MNANATTTRYARGDSTNLRLSLLTAAVLAAYSPLGRANPEGMAVIQGQAAAARDGTTLTITNTPGSILHWQSFSIGTGETTRFVQQDASSAVLNRVIGQDPSAILGTLSSNGRVFLLNPNGILFGRDARIDVAGLVASTLNLSDQDFLAGRINLTDNGSAGAIRNDGVIRSSSGGNVYLVAPEVVNAGSIETPGGETVLAAGRALRLGDTGAPGVLVELDASDEGVTNLGTVEASGGAVNIYAGMIDQRGIVRAGSAQIDAAGRVLLVASRDVTLAAGSETSASGAAGGSVHVQATNGTLMTEGAVATVGGQAAGGEVVLTGRQVGLTGGATVDASGATGGGQILVGGDAHGGNADVQNSRAVFAGAGTTLRADASGQGDGGRVILWSDEATRSYGEISARGGRQGGDGGFVETSSKGYLEAASSPDVSATNGSRGTWLLDPLNLEVVDVITGTPVPGSTSFTPSTTNSQVLASAIETTLNLDGNVTLQTSGTTGPEAGDIIVNAAIDKTGGAGTASLSLIADGSVIINQPVTATSGSLNLLTATGFAAGNSVQINASITLGANGLLDATGGGSRVRFASGPVAFSGATLVTGTVEVTTGADATISANVSSNDAAVSGGVVRIGSGFQWNTPQLSLSGGSIEGNGTLLVSQTFLSTGGTVAMSGTTGTVGITQQSGDLDIASLISAGTVNLTANLGRIDDVRGGTGPTLRGNSITLTSCSFCTGLSGGIGSSTTPVRIGDLGAGVSLSASLSGLTSGGIYLDGTSGTLNLANVSNQTNGGGVELKNSGAITIGNAGSPTVSSNNGAITISALGGGITGTGGISSRGSSSATAAGAITLNSAGDVVLNSVHAGGAVPFLGSPTGVSGGSLTINLTGTTPSRDIVIGSVNVAGDAGINGIATGDPGGNGASGGSFTINGGGRDVALSFVSADLSGGNAGTPFGGTDGAGGHAGTMTVNNAGGLLSIEGDLLAAGGDSLTAGGATGSGPAGNGGVITLNSGTIFVGIGPTDPPITSSLQVDVSTGATTGTPAVGGKLELVGGTGFEPFTGGGNNGGLAIDGLGNLQMVPGSRLVANATGSIVLDGPNNVIDSLSGSSSAGRIEVFSTTTLKAGPLSAAGTIDLWVEGSGQQLITDGTLVAGGDITLTGNALGSLVQDVSTNGAVTTSGTLFINADDWEISGGTGNLQAATAIQWTTRGTTPLTLDMTAGVNRFVTPMLRFGSALAPIANDIQFIDNVNLAGLNALTLPTTLGSASIYTTGNVSQAVPLVLLSGGGLQVTAASVSLADTGNRFGTLAGKATTGSFAAADADGFALGTVDGISGITLPANGGGALFAAAGDLVIGTGAMAAGQTGNWTVGAGPTGKVVVSGANSAASMTTQTGTLLQLQNATLNLSGSGLINDGSLNVAGSSTVAGALINNASVTTGTSALALQSLTQSASTATLSGNLSVSGTAALSGGGLNSGASLVVLPTTGVLSLSGSVNINGMLTNQGSGTIAGTVTTDGGGKIANQGVLTLSGAQVAAHLDNQDIGPSVGTITVSGAPSSLTGLFSNAPNATVSIAAGGTLNATGTSVNDGSIVNDGTLAVAGSFTSPGSLTNRSLFSIGSGTTTVATLNNTGTASGAGGTLSVANYAAGAGAAVAGGYAALSLSNPGTLALGAGSYSASVSGALALGAATSLSLSGISASAGTATLSAPTIAISGAQVSTVGDMSVAAPATLTVDGSSGSAKLLAGGVMTVKAGLVNVIGGTGGASIDPTALNLSATGDLTLTGGSAIGARAEIFGDTVTVSAANINLTGGTATDTSARIASTAGDLSVATGGLLTLAMGASADADAILTAQGGSAMIAAASCIGCTTLGSDPTGNGAVDGGAFATNGVLFSLANAQLVDNSIIFATDVASNSGEGTATNYTVGASTELAADDGATSEGEKDGEDGTAASTTEQTTASGEQNVGIPACN